MEIQTCDNCGKTNAKSQCSRCKSVYYCNRECQIACWKKHKKICNSSPQAFSYEEKINKIHDIITTTEAGNGEEIKNLIVQGDLLSSAEKLARLERSSYNARARPQVIILAGSPSCVGLTPPTESDGLASIALGLAIIRLGFNVTFVSEKCNESVFRAAVEGVKTAQYSPNPMMRDVPFPMDDYSRMKLHFVESPILSSEDEEELDLKYFEKADLVISCGRPGPAADGNCYTMAGMNMTEKDLIAPLHNIVSDFKDHGMQDRKKFIAIGDGGNKLGMGKVKDKVYKHMDNGEQIGAVDTIDGKNLVADYLIAASVSNWGTYALIAAAALVRAHDSKDRNWIKAVLPTEESERALLDRCVGAGCRDGVSVENVATVGGMPLERSLKCLREIRKVALGHGD